MHSSTPTRTRGLIAAFSALALVLAGCGGADDEPQDQPSAAQEESAPEDAPDDAETGTESGAEDGDAGDQSEAGEADESAETDDSDESDDAGESEADESDDDDSGPALPTKVEKAGKVAPGAAKTASGKGDALVTFEQSDSFSVVAEFDCDKCKGDIEIQQLGSHSPLDTGKKSLKGSYLLDIIGSADEPQTLIVRADGEWSTKFYSWNDLPISSGNQEGKGSKVLYVGDATSAIEVDYKPPKDGGKLSVTATSAVQKDGDAPKVVTVSGGKKFTKKKDIKLPGVLTISGKGSWTIKLIP